MCHALPELFPEGAHVFLVESGLCEPLEALSLSYLHISLVLLLPKLRDGTMEVAVLSESRFLHRLGVQQDLPSINEPQTLL